MKNKEIILQAMYLKYDTISNMVLDSSPKTFNDFLKTIKKEKDRPKKRENNDSLFRATSVLQEAIGWLIMKELNLTLEMLWECFEDHEFVPFLNFDYDLKETEDCVCFNFMTEDNIRFTKDIQNCLLEYGVNHVKELKKPNTFYVEVFKKDLESFALEIIDSNPIEYIRSIKYNPR